MSCSHWFCKEPVAAFIVKSRITHILEQVCWKSGGLINCDNPRDFTILGVCDWHLKMREIKLPTPESRWPEGAEL